MAIKLEIWEKAILKLREDRMESIAHFWGFRPGSIAKATRLSHRTNLHDLRLKSSVHYDIL